MLDRTKTKVAVTLLLCFSVVGYAQTTEVVLIQLNDIYEITPLEGGKYGGMARVAHVVKQLKSRNLNTFTFVAGDFISPSALGTADYEGKRINGAQMIDVLNHLPVDYVTFGNHEFDVKPEILQERINESKFIWFSSNIRQNVSDSAVPFVKLVDGKPVPFSEYQIVRIRSPSGKEFRIGMIGITLNRVASAVYEDANTSAARVYQTIKDSADIFIALTHLSIDEDKQLASSLPVFTLIMGGHEHSNMLEKVGKTVITKADANARTVYIHTIKFDESKKSNELQSELKTIDGSIPDDSVTAGIIRLWVDRAFKGFRAKGLNPEEEVTVLPDTLDGREVTVRFKPSNLGELIAKAMVSVSEKSKMAAFNSGAIRIDDELFGEITQYDIIRTLPFGGKIVEVHIKGSLLRKILEAGAKSEGLGAYLQMYGIENIEAASSYWIALSDFLLSGNEQNMEFLTRDNADIIEIIDPKPDASDLRNDIRLAVINYLKSAK